MDIAQHRIVLLQGQLRNGGLDLFLNLGLQLGIDRKRHLEHAVQWALVIDDRLLLIGSA